MCFVKLYVIFMLLYCSSKKKTNPKGVNLGIGLEIDYLGEFELIFGRALEYKTGRKRKCFNEQKKKQNISFQCPFK